MIQAPAGIKTDRSKTGTTETESRSDNSLGRMEPVIVILKSVRFPN